MRYTASADKDAWASVAGRAEVCLQAARGQAGPDARSSVLKEVVVDGELGYAIGINIETGNGRQVLSLRVHDEPAHADTVARHSIVGRRDQEEYLPARKREISGDEGFTLARIGTCRTAVPVLV